jgi:membrane protein required for colicin V production
MMSYLNYVDIILVLGLLWAAYKGWQSGLLRSLAGLLGLLLGYFLAFALGQRVGGLITARDDPAQGAVLVGFVLVFLGTLVVFYFIGRFLRAYLQATPLGVADSVAGGALGGIKGVLVFGLLLMLLMAHPLGNRVRDTVEASRLAAPVQRGALLLVDFVRAVVPRAESLVDALGIRPSGPPPPVLDDLSQKAGEANGRIDNLLNETKKRLDK